MGKEGLEKGEKKERIGLRAVRNNCGGELMRGTFGGHAQVEDFSKLWPKRETQQGKSSKKNAGEALIAGWLSAGGEDCWGTKKNHSRGDAKLPEGAAC